MSTTPYVWNKGDWAVTTDDVMGGVSTASWDWTESGSLAWEGNLSKENRGGFVWLRLDTRPDLADISGYDSIVVEMTGDGQIYDFHLYDDSFWDTYSTRQFTTTKGVRSRATFPLDKFSREWRSIPIPGWLSKDKIKGVGFLLWDGAEEGPFDLTIHDIFL